MPVRLPAMKRASIHRLYSMNGMYHNRMRTECLLLVAHGRSCSYDLSHDLEFSMPKRNL